jgi:hypothetical protein
LLLRGIMRAHGRFLRGRQTIRRHFGEAAESYWSESP